MDRLISAHPAIKQGNHHWHAERDIDETAQSGIAGARVTTDPGSA